MLLCGPDFFERTWLPLRIAEHSHARQPRHQNDAANPYVIHPLRTAILRLEAGATERDAVTKALVHHVGNGSGRHTLDDVGRLVGPEVRAMAWSLTDPIPDGHLDITGPAAYKGDLRALPETTKMACWHAA